MKTERDNLSSDPKATYETPALVDLGNINEITEAVNNTTGGDSQFSVLGTS